MRSLYGGEDGIRDNQIENGVAMITVAMWTIFDRGNKKIISFTYKDKINAAGCLAELNEKFRSKEGGPDYFRMQMTKEPADTLTGSKLVQAIDAERSVRITKEDKKTGEVRRYSKAFTDIETITLTETGIVVKDVFTAHYFRGELRVTGYKNLKAFEDYCIRRWPEQHNIVLALLPSPR